MFGVIIVAITSFFDEISNSITKAKLEEHAISLYSIGAINTMVVTAIFFMVSAVNGEFRFSLASLPTFLPRAALEVFLTTLMLRATKAADRSTFGFIRVLTIPLLLLADLSLGYVLNGYQLFGIAAIILALFIVFSNQGIKKQGSGAALLTAVLAAATISLYKYDITYFNSVTAEQALINSITLVYLFGMAVFSAKENPFVFLKQKIYRYQILVNAVPGFFNSYAYAFAPASVILSAWRSSSVFWCVASGQFYFHEKHLAIKLLCLALLVGGIILLAL